MRYEDIKDWKESDIIKPNQLGVQVIESLSLDILVPYIDWSPFFRSWDLHGRYPNILKDNIVGAQATELFHDAQVLLARVLDEKLLEARAIFGLFPANSIGDDIEVYPLNQATEKKPLATFLSLRQQLKKREGVPNLALSDFIAPKTNGLDDYIGCFCVTTGFGTDTLAEEDLALFEQIVEQYTQEHNVPATEVAAALARLAQGDKPLLVKHAPAMEQRQERGKRSDHSEGTRRERRSAPVMDESQIPKPERGMERYRLEVGEVHGVKAGNIVGAIANEIGIEGEYINQVNIQDGYTTVDLPEGMPKQVFNTLRKIRVAGQELNASKMEDAGFSEGGYSGGRREGRKPPMRRSGGKPGGDRKPRDGGGRGAKGRPGKDKKRTPRK